MIRRTRRDLLDLHFLIFSIRLRPAPHSASAEALVEECGVPLRLVLGIEESGLLRSEASGHGRSYDGDEARGVAVAEGRGHGRSARLRRAIASIDALANLI